MSIREIQKRYYERLLGEHGDDPRSLGHRDRATQFERFRRIAAGFPSDASITVHEIGCGLGDFGEYLALALPRATYSGSDIVEGFVERCRRRFPGSTFRLRDISAEPAPERYDFVTQSGTFNGRLETPDADFRKFIEAMIRAMYGLCTRGIVFNFLNAACDETAKQDRLHYQEMATLIDWLNIHVSRHFEIDAAGPLYEFTVRVYRPEHVRASYPDRAFARYFR